MPPLPSLVKLATAEDYRRKYVRDLCQQKVITFDGIRIYFGEQRFWHAFCTRDANGKKKQFSFDRAQYIDWIKPTLEHSAADLFQGWNNDEKVHEPHRRVSVVFKEFVVIVEMGLKLTGDLKGNFVTAFLADNSIGAIRQSPTWDKAACLSHLKAEQETKKAPAMGA